ncbi:MAG: hypothetical protein JRN23_07510 [Nitrososphaerota archaeon]|nr:hypothetical protein [Nitrososphaerota archaeon]MDG7021764.1 hypothetical protein [Nitrososphaerota archaeon]
MSEEKPPSVTVRLKRGTWEVEITCAPEKVQQAVESVLAGMVSREQVSIEASMGAPPPGEEAKRFDTCRGLLERMWKEGWFSSEKTLGEVHEELARRGYHYDRTAVSHALVDLVREGTLFRDGTMRNYRYVQKRPLDAQGAAP